MTAPFLAGGQGEKIRIDVEVCCRPECSVDPAAVREAVGRWLASLATVRYSEGPIWPQPGEHPALQENVESIRIVDLSDRAKPGCTLLAWDVAWDVRRSAACLLGRPHTCCSTLQY